jgi:regulator of protease activity HflC (stomatin/prohibitin superfamily)
MAINTGVLSFEDFTATNLQKARKYWDRNKHAVYLSLLFGAFLMVVLSQWVFVTVPAGHVGVMWYRLFEGTDTDATYQEGIHLLFPWDHMEIYDARVQHVERDFQVLTKDGLTVTVNVAWRFRVKKKTVGRLHKFVGPHYEETVLVPIVGSYVRQVFSQYAMDDAYTTRREEIQEQIRDGVTAELGRGVPRAEATSSPWILVENILLRGMHFPPEVEAAVNRKMEQYQVREEYMYRLERERLESERKQVEAEGIARFQRIVGAGISDKYLRWKGIDATLALARSNNTKVVVIGSARDGMPLILGGADGAVTDNMRPERTGVAQPEIHYDAAVEPPVRATQATSVEHAPTDESGRRVP